MSDPIEIILGSGLNWVVYKIDNDIGITSGIEVMKNTMLYIKKNNQFIQIGTLGQVRNKRPPGSSTQIMGSTGTEIATMNPYTGVLSTTLYADRPKTTITPSTITNRGGKRKTKKSFRKSKNDKRKYKREKKRKTRKNNKIR